ncbi:MAG: MFS transporter [Bifidobacteriaceae bacterium]|nr:MFS transporter [Bifidobacteriaceae bacterium]
MEFLRNTFKALAIYNYRIWFFGALISNIGTNLQRTAQDWLVIDVLTDNSATQVGIVMALQFAPQLVMMPISGIISDRLNLRHVLFFTQSAQGILAAGMYVLIYTNHVTLNYVYIFALLLGIVASIDSTARQVFVSQLVSGEYVVNAVSLNSTSFSLGRLIGPTFAGITIAMFGTAFSFALNAVSFLFVLVSLFFIKKHKLYPIAKSKKVRGAVKETYDYLKTRPDMVGACVCLAFVGIFGFNFTVYLSKITTTVYNLGSSGYGILTSLLGLGAVFGALELARRQTANMRIILFASIAFAALLFISGFFALLPTPVPYIIMLPLIGFISQLGIAATNSFLQITSPEHVRGRIMSLYLGVFAGTTPIGSPLMGYVADNIGTQQSIIFGAIFTAVPIMLVYIWIARIKQLKVRIVLPKTPTVLHPTMFGTLMHSFLTLSVIHVLPTDKRA